MRMIDVALKEEYGFLQGGNLQGWLGDYPWDGERNPSWKRPALIVVPGGGYGMVSKREAEPIASYFYGKGFQVFILTYMCEPQGAYYPEQLLELASAVDYVKKNAKDFDVNAEEIFAVGFSAGGQLVANLAVEHQEVAEKAGQALCCKPTAVGLCYPVISSTHGHMGSYVNLLKRYPEAEQVALKSKLNLDERVNEQTPPAFLWATATDNVVPADNTLRYALAMARNNRPYEVHVYPEGIHGLSACNMEICQDGDVTTKTMARWMDDCAAFFRRYTEEKF